MKKSENEFYTLAEDRLSKLAEGHNDISGEVVNVKQPAKGYYVRSWFGGFNIYTINYKNLYHSRKSKGL